MSAAQHTPGPWIATRDPAGFASDDFLVGHEGGNADSVATCSECDAPIISAAPDMLEALRNAERMFEHTFAMNGTVHKQMIAAIAKAEGRS